MADASSGVDERVREPQKKDLTPVRARSRDGRVMAPSGRWGYALRSARLLRFNSFTTEGKIVDPPGGVSRIFLWIVSGAAQYSNEHPFSARTFREAGGSDDMIARKRSDGRQHLLGTQAAKGVPYFDYLPLQVWRFFLKKCHGSSSQPLWEKHGAASLSLDGRRADTERQWLLRAALHLYRGRVVVAFLRGMVLDRGSLVPAPERFVLPISCAVCGAMEKKGQPLLKCARCRCTSPTYYCSKEHQKAHWSQHKRTCVLRLDLALPSPDDKAGDAQGDEGDGDIWTHRVTDDALFKIFAACVDADTVAVLPTLQLVCRHWCHVGRRDALWRHLRFDCSRIGLVRSEKVNVPWNVSPEIAEAYPAAALLRQLFIGTRADHVLRLEFCGFDGSTMPGYPIEACITFALSTLRLPKLTAVTFRECTAWLLTSAPGEGRLLVPLTSAQFYPLRTLIDRPGRPLTELRMIRSGINAVDFLDLLRVNRDSLRTLEIESKGVKTFVDPPERGSTTVYPVHLGVPASSTVFGRPVATVNSDLTAFSMLTELKLDLRRRPLVLNEALCSLLELRTLDLAFSFVVSAFPVPVCKGSRYASKTMRAWADNGYGYAHLTDLTLRYVPVGGHPGFAAGDTGDTLLFGPPGSGAVQPVCGASELFQYVADEPPCLDFFFASARKLRVLRLVCENFECGRPTFHTDLATWPLGKIQSLLRPPPHPEDALSPPRPNALEVLELDRSVNLGKDGRVQESDVHTFLATFGTTLTDVNLRYLCDGTQFVKAGRSMEQYVPVPAEVLQRDICEVQPGLETPPTGNLLSVLGKVPSGERFTAFSVGGCTSLRRFQVTRVVARGLIELSRHDEADNADRATLKKLVRAWAPNLDTCQIIDHPADRLPYPLVKYWELHEQTAYERNLVDMLGHDGLREPLFLPTE
eukprot:m.145016 g.145016  ORF g.145016 m.145016 type:complete len:921 (-) comp14111_c0_seq1:3876-6638(-)